MHWIRRGLAALLLLTLLAALVLAIYAWRTLPPQEGKLVLAGARGEIRIERDAHGIPTIVAADPLDAYYGLGVVHAQDRLWQLETHRRIGAGRTAEAFGPAALEADRFLRALGVRRAAEAQWARAPAASRAVVEAYTAGINAVVSQGGQARAPEFVVLGLQLARWEPADTFAWAIMMAWDLGGNWNTELLRLRLALKLPVERIEQLLPPYPGDPVPATADYTALYRSLGLGSAKVAALTRGLDAAPPSGVEGMGSNNWVLAGSRTTTGSPLLANDPHLKLSAPALWYLARLRAPGLDVAGATMPGLPFVVLGQNADIAWGFTNTGPDVQDLYLEQTDPADPNRVRTPEGFAPLQVQTDTIRVKGAPDVPVTLRRSRHGPVISDAGGMADALGAKPGFLLAMRWTALDPDNDPVAVGLAVQRARTVDETFTAAQGLVAPMQNLVAADRAGRIGVITPGRVPVRAPENDLGGRVPAPGWDARYDWTGFIPPHQTPRRRDPAIGWIATANQRITEPGYRYHLTHEWALPYRQQRIEQVLESRPKHSLQDLAALQMDGRSLAMATLLPWLKRAADSLQGGHPLAAAAKEQLEGFAADMAVDKPAPLIAWAWQRQLAKAVFADDAGEALWEKSLAGRTFQDALEGVLARDDASWCDDRGTPAAETCAQQAGLALARALDELAVRHGNDVASWRWGAVHVARSEHRPFSRVPVLRRLFELRTPVGGDTHTVMAMRVSLREDKLTGDLYHVDHSASLRAVYDVADRTRSGVVHSTGQSGIVFSPRYRDQVGPWTRGELLPLWPQGDPATVLLVQPAR
ncbi:MAG: penicillin acylase family protein [Ideonella sp. WA131b]|jgi:penicillin amidase|nr:penicillin acylase family protein [Ideonella sp. WA131b]